MKFLIAINSLVQGGAQKFTVQLASELIHSGHEVTLLVFYPEETDFFKAPSGAKITRFIHPFHDNGRKPRLFFPVLRNLQFRLNRILWRLADLVSLRRLLSTQDYDLIIGVEKYTGVLLGTVVKKKSKLLISERVHPNYHSIQFPFNLLAKYVYRKKNVFVHAQGHDIARAIRTEHKCIVAVIPNFVISENIEKYNPLNQNKTVLALGRFDNQKGFDLLIKSWKLLPEKYLNEWKLKIYGDNDPSPFQSIVESEGLIDSVELRGADLDTAKLFSNASIFVLSSRYEGFPNALAEAMSYGLPCIATDCPSAVRELTLNGSLANLTSANEYAISTAILELIEDEQMRLELSERAKLVNRYFNQSQIMPVWEQLFNEIVNSSNESVKSKCQICGSRVTKRNICDLRLRNQIRNDLETYWDINIIASDLRLPSTIYRYKCNKCKISFFNSTAGDNLFYKACHKSSKYSRSENWDYVQVLDYLNSNVLFEGSRILDYGSGFSRFTDLIIDSRNILDIVEIDKDLLEAQSSIVRRGYIDLEFIEGKYSLIMISHYLEHVENPKEFIRSICHLLEPNGKFAITVPDANFNEDSDSVLDWPPHHTFRFTQFGLNNLMKNLGFELEKTLVKNEINDGSNFDFCSIYRLARN